MFGRSARTGADAATMVHAKQAAGRDSMQFARRADPGADPAAINRSRPVSGRKKIGMESESRGTRRGLAAMGQESPCRQRDGRRGKVADFGGRDEDQAARSLVRAPRAASA